MTTNNNKPYSSSPIPSKQSPSSRNSEMNNPMRRSFAGSPFVKPSIVANQRGFNTCTPANSPSDYSIRKSVSRESTASLRDYEDKENGRDPNLKPGRVRSPAAPKGTKNFMSPTISAASKIAASPKKKVLIERSEPVHTSVTSVSMKSPRSVSFADFVEEINLEPEVDVVQRKTVSFHDVTVTDMDKGGVDEDNLSSKLVQREAATHSMVSPCSQKAAEPSETVGEGEDCDNAHARKTTNHSPIPISFPVSASLNAEPSDTVAVEQDSVDAHASPISAPVLAPLDTDPSMPPYDPKTNYLSPRPQFLHYKPNPKIESYLHRDREGKRFEDGLFSEVSSDSEETPSEDSQIESEDTSSGEMVEDDEVEVQNSEPHPVGTVTKQESTVAKAAPKLRLFTRSKFVGLLLALLVACSTFAVNNYPVTQPHAFEDSTLSRLYIPPEICQFARESLSSLTQKFWQWWSISISHVHKLISRFREARENGFLPYNNFSMIHNDHPVDGYGWLNHRDDRNPRTGPIIEREVEDQTVEGQSGTEAEIEWNDDPAYGEQPHNIDQISKEHNNAEFERLLNTEACLNDNDVPNFDEQLHRELGANNNILEFLEGRSDETQLSHQDELVESSDNPESKLSEVEVNLAVQGNLDFDVQSVSQDPIIHPQMFEVESNEVDSIPENLEAADEHSQALMMHDSHEVLEYPSTQQESVKALEQFPENDLISSAHSESIQVDVGPKSMDFVASDNNAETSVKVDASHEWFNDKILERFAFFLFGATCLVILLYATSLVFPKKAKTPTSNAVFGQEQKALKKFHISPKTATFEHRPCASELSSFQGNSLYGCEAESHERRRRKSYKRESLASSDLVGSPSYGSFTTYEKLSSKLGEEEVITPVRRSSRIRKHVT